MSEEIPLSFENPGHRQRLQQSGALEPGQVHITPEEFANNLEEIADDPERLALAINILMQEMRTYSMYLVNMRDYLFYTGKNIERIMDEASYKKAEDMIIELYYMVEKATIQADTIYRICQKVRQDNLTPEAHSDLYEIGVSMRQMRKSFAELRPELIGDEENPSTLSLLHEELLKRKPR